MISIQIATGSTSDSHPLSVNARPIWIKIYPTLHLSDSHPLSCKPSLRIFHLLSNLKWTEPTWMGQARCRSSLEYKYSTVIKLECVYKDREKNSTRVRLYDDLSRTISKKNRGSPPWEKVHLQDVWSYATPRPWENQPNACNNIGMSGVKVQSSNTWPACGQI